jgi:hypothetical protein
MGTCRQKSTHWWITSRRVFGAASIGVVQLIRRKWNPLGGIQGMYGTVEAQGPIITEEGKRVLVVHSRHRPMIGGTTTRGVMCDDLRYDQRSKQYSKARMGSLPWHPKKE